MTPAILVLGLGNLLLADDGAGVHALRAFRDCCPDDVLAVEVGTAILHAEHLIEAADYVLALDAMRAGGPPGSVYLSPLGNIADEYAGSDSVHDLTLVSVMRHLRKRPRECVIIGAEPQVIEIGMELSPPVAAAIPRLVAAALDIIERWQSGRAAAKEDYHVPCGSR